MQLQVIQHCRIQSTRSSPDLGMFKLLKRAKNSKCSRQARCVQQGTLCKELQGSCEMLDLQAFWSELFLEEHLPKSCCLPELHFPGRRRRNQADICKSLAVLALKHA